MEVQTSVERAKDGTWLATYHWPSDRPAWAGVLILHGLAEHAGRHRPTAHGLAVEGLDVHAYDQRGFGGSGGRRAYVGDWSELHSDVAERLAGVRAANPGLPVVLYGHSLGGLVALGAVLEGVARPDLLVLSAPAIGDDLPAPKKLAAKVLGRILPTMEIPNGLDGEVLSSDPEVGRAYAADPLCHHRTTARFATLGIAAQARALDRLGQLAVPTLVVHGGDDRLVRTASSEPLARLPNVTRMVYPGLRHEMHNEPDGGQVLADVVGWIRGRIGGQQNTASGERDSAESVARPLTRGT
jgi:alpha-beta hydrolase superfamily lysophospholipase